MIKIWEWIKNNPNRTMFLIPIILVAGISISHVVTWYDIANPFNWSIYLSIAIEVGAMTALVAATNKIKGGVFFMFGLITIIQMIGNIFYSFNEIDPNGSLFKSWVELTSPIWELFGSDTTDIPAMKRWLAFLEGGLLPIISLTSLHFFVKYDNGKSITEGITEGINEDVNDDKVTKLSDLQEESERVWDNVKKLRSEDKLPILDQEDIETEPTALAFTPNEVETTETISDDIRNILDENDRTMENTKFPIDMMLETDDRKEIKNTRPKRLRYKGKDV